MITRRAVPVEELKEGMIADRDIDDRLGRNLLARGTVLNAMIIDAIKKRGITAIYIREESDTKEEDSIPDSPSVQYAYEQYHKPDPATVDLSDEVRSRVSEGIKYIYTDIHSEEMATAANSITNDLMDAINSNDAVAIDISTLKTSDEYTFKHSVDVAAIAMIQAKHLGLSKEDVHDIGLAGLLHDIGKAEIPPEILNKPSRLTDREFEVMKKHPIIAYQTLAKNPQISSNVALAVLQHHEKMNGQGYPMKLKSPQITLFGKILAVADIYDALVTERPYKPAYTQRDAVEMIMSMVEELDLTAMRAFLESMILYPVNSIVSLSNGEKAKVLQNNPHYILRPTVVGLDSGKVYDLGQDLSYASIVIL